jgi:hypothetical protein
MAAFDLFDILAFSVRDTGMQNPFDPAESFHFWDLWDCYLTGDVEGELRERPSLPMPVAGVADFFVALWLAYLGRRKEPWAVVMEQAAREIAYRYAAFAEDPWWLDQLIRHYCWINADKWGVAHTVSYNAILIRTSAIMGFTFGNIDPTELDGWMAYQCPTARCC